MKVAGDISVGELAKLAGLKAPLIQGKLMALGIMVSVNQSIDFNTVEKLGAEMGSMRSIPDSRSKSSWIRRLRKRSRVRTWRRVRRS